MLTAEGSAVLAVDDDRDTRTLVRRILLGAGLVCLEARDGESGLTLALETGVSAAVVSLSLPRMSGAELAWRLRGHFPDLPVVAVSGHLDLWDADDLADLGIREALPKPVEPRKLVRAVVDALSHLQRSRKPLRPDGQGHRLDRARGVKKRGILRGAN